MSNIINFYDATDLEPGDVLVTTVTLHVTYHRDEKNKPYFRMYRCDYPRPPMSEDGIPQGNRIFDEQKVADTLFPVVSNLGLKSEG